MIISDWINIICATISLVVTVIIAVLQIKQSNRMEKFERRQDAIEEERHAETVRAQAVSFVSKYYSDRGLIPLKIPHEEYQYEKCITDIISEAFRSKKFDEKPIEYLALKFDFGNAEEIEACQLTTFIAECIAIYGENKEESNKYYGAPGAYDGEEIKTMEDLFLKAVFEIYTNLVI